MYLLFSLLFITPIAYAEPDWSQGVVIDSPRSNPYQLNDTEFKKNRTLGLGHTLYYPVEISGTLAPWIPIQNFLDKPQIDPLKIILQKAFEGFSKIKSSDDLLKLAGLHTYPKNSGEEWGEIPDPKTKFSNRMGAGFFEKDDALAMTISCAACHSSNLFGKRVLGLTNRFPRANEFFHFGKKASQVTSPILFASFLNPTPAEFRLFKRLKYHLNFIGVKKPVTLGLDTSLAQVALSLSRRGTDPYASLDPKTAKNPRSEKLETFVADSKPAVWWNLKYKNRWLSDGSVVSGNPIYTNILWNEIGRGTDLKELQTWLTQNNQTIKELTTAVFSTEAPRFTDFFEASKVSLTRAKNGETIYNQLCAKCHGTYVKAWSLENHSLLPLSEQIKTIQVQYKKTTPVIDVGTDPNRYLGMESLERGLNPLSISQANGIRIATQKGYVPPPLVGIWARWPYFHNNSAPNLCAVLSPSAERPVTYYAGEALNPNTDFDEDCVGYPVGADVPQSWKQNSDFLYDTRKPGLKNTGHDVNIFIKDGVNLLTPLSRRDLIEFLKTL